MSNLIKDYCEQQLVCPCCNKTLPLFYSRTRYRHNSQVWEYTATLCMECQEYFYGQIAKVDYYIRISESLTYRRIRDDSVVLRRNRGTTMLMVRDDEVNCG